jgi:hypothetical protein
LPTRPLAGQAAERVDLLEAEPDVDHLKAAAIAVPPGAGAQVLGDRKTLAIEVGEQEDRHVGAAERFDQLQLGLGRLPFVADDRDIVTEVELLEPAEVGNAPLLDNQ